MLTHFHTVMLAFSLLLPASRALAEAENPEPARYSVEQLQQDFRFMQDLLVKTHPDPAHSISAQQLGLAYKNIEAQLREPMTRDEAWRVLATLNPLFADAHLLVGQADWLGQIAAHLKAGGTLFPYEVQIDAMGEVHIRSELGGATGPMAGVRIDQINGIPARAIANELMARMHGDTLEFRANLLSQRWWFFYWKMYGESASYDFLLAKSDGVVHAHIPASVATPALVKDNAVFDKQFKIELLSDRTALLTVNTFYWPDKALYLDFMRRAFAALRDAKVATLLIDIRGNGGGNDDMWIDGVLRYIADQPYRWASRYRKKVIQGRQSQTEKVGDVITGVVDTWIKPELDHPLHFSGKSYLLVGRGTYSSSILLSNVMQDFGFGKVVGGGYARTSQSGGTQSTTLPNTGLVISVPRFILERPSGRAEPVLVRPDIVLKDDPTDNRAMVDALRVQIGASMRQD